MKKKYKLIFRLFHFCGFISDSMEIRRCRRGRNGSLARSLQACRLADEDAIPHPLALQTSRCGRRIRLEAQMGNRQLRSPRVLVLLMMAAAVPLSMSACGAGDDDGGDKASTLVTSDATALEGVRADADCTAVHDWVARNANQLPTSYADLVRYPMSYRRAIFSALDPDAKSSLWKEHFVHYLDEHPDLTAAQAAFIEKMISSVSAEFYIRLKDDPAAKKSLDHLKAEGSALFDKDSLGRLVSQLGPDPDPASGPPRLELFGGCTCNTEDDWCTWGYDCIGGNCNDTVDGCGWWGSDPCNGLCHDV